MPGKREGLAATMPVHGSQLKVDSCRIFFSKERDIHQLAGCQVVGAEAEAGRTEGDTDRISPIPPAAVWQTQSLVSWMLTATTFRYSQQTLRTLVPAFHATRRTYALSRFPQRSPGVGRRRQHVENDNYRSSTSGFKPAHEEVPREEQPSSEMSPLWQESARSINSDPAEGLKRLLMTHESLVVTRLASPGFNYWE